MGGYKVRVWETDKDVSQANDTEVLIGHRLETTITNLTPGKTYYLRVLAYSQGGEGKMSSPVWQFQMGDPEALNSAEPQFKFIAFHNDSLANNHGSNFIKHYICERVINTE